MNRPRWLSDEPELLELLHRFLDKLERKTMVERARSPAENIKRDAFPKLFRLDAGADREWVLLQQLAQDYQLFSIGLKRRRDAFAPEFDGARIELNPERVDVIRVWLDRPETLSCQHQWQAALAELMETLVRAGDLPADVDVSGIKPINIAGKSAVEVVQALAKATRWKDRDASLRQLSAWCFWGQSKLLDHREDLINCLFPGLQIRPRKLLVNVCLPSSFNTVLFVENQENYVSAIESGGPVFEGLTLIYCAGFRGSAQRVRTSNGVSFHYHAAGPGAPRKEFESWWFNTEETLQSCHFWGDLDFSGMGILKALRQRFDNMQAWQKGYAQLLHYLQKGGGHSAVAARKSEQYDPGITGCDYADTTLLPALRDLKRFVDQELLLGCDLKVTNMFLHEKLH